MAPFVIATGVIVVAVGFAQIVRAKARKEGLVTSGLYKYVRHPQHLGIAILSLGLLMLNRYGIRIGDIYTWTLVVFIYILLGDHEEEDLEKQLGEDYIEYKRRVPFIIPFVPSIQGRIPRIMPSYGWKRILALVGLYFIILVLITWLLMSIPRYHVR